MTDYTTSPLYQKGQMFKEFGELLMNPKSNVHDLADFGLRWDLEVDLLLAIAPGLSTDA